MPDSFESRPLPKTVILELTRRCNNKCLYCYTVWGNPDQNYDGGCQSEMSTQELKDVVGRLQEEVHIEDIGLSGGEPTLREDLPEILSYLQEKGISSTIITNGTLLSDDLIDKTVDMCLYEITLLSFRREIHDQLAGRSGAWDEAVAGMARLKRAGGTFVAVFVATKLNYRDLPRTLELAMVLGAKGLMYNRLNLSSHNLSRADELLMTPEMIEQNLNSLEELGKKYGLPIAASVVIEPCVVDIRKYRHVQLGWCPLAGEESYFTIDPAGNIRICNHSPVILGNIKRDSFPDIYYKDRYVRSFHEEVPEECRNCQSEFSGVCCGGCKAAAEQCYGTIKRADPFVALNQK